MSSNLKYTRKSKPLWANTKREMEGLSETTRVLYGEPILSKRKQQSENTKRGTKPIGRKRRRATHRSQVQKNSIQPRPRLERSKTEVHKNPYWGLPSETSTSYDDSEVLPLKALNIVSFMDTREDTKLLDAIGLREDYLTRMRELTTPFLEVDPTAKKVVDSSFFDMQELVDLVDLLRFVTVEVIEGIAKWRLRRSHFCSCDTKDGQGRVIHACGNRSPYIWKGENYLLKITSDLDFLSKVPKVKEFVSFPLLRNPFVLPEPLSPLSYSKDLRSSSCERTYSPPVLDMRRIRKCSDILLQEEEMHGVRPVSRGMGELDLVTQARLEVEWSKRMAKRVMPKLARVIVSGNLRLCFERQDVDGDGYLSYHEFERALQRMAQFKLDSKEELDWLLITLDREDARCITYHAFQDLVAKAKARKEKRVVREATKSRLRDKDRRIAAKKQSAESRVAQEYPDAEAVGHHDVLLGRRSEALNSKLDSLLNMKASLLSRIDDTKNRIETIERESSGETRTADHEALDNPFGARAQASYRHPRRLHLEYPKSRLKKLQVHRRELEDLLYEFQQSLRTISSDIVSVQASLAVLKREQELRQEEEAAAVRKRLQEGLEASRLEMERQAAAEQQRARDLKREALAQEAAAYKEEGRMRRREERRLARLQQARLRNAAAIAVQKVTRSFLCRLRLSPMKSKAALDRLKEERGAMFREELRMRDLMCREKNKEEIMDFLDTHVLGGAAPFGVPTRPTPVVIFVVNVPGNARTVKYFMGQLNQVMPGFFCETPFAIETPLSHRPASRAPNVSLGRMQDELNTHSGLVVHIHANKNEFYVESAQKSLMRSIRPLLATLEPFPVCVLADFSAVNDGRSSQPTSSLEALAFQKHCNRQTVKAVLDTLTGNSSRALMLEITRSADQSNPSPSFLLLLAALDAVLAAFDQRDQRPAEPARLHDQLLLEWGRYKAQLLQHPKDLIARMKEVTPDKIPSAIITALSDAIADRRWPQPTYRQRPALSLVRDWLVALFELAVLDRPGHAGRERRSESESKAQEGREALALHRLGSAMNMTRASKGETLESRGVAVWRNKGGGVFDVRLCLNPGTEPSRTVQRHVDVVVHLSLRSLLEYRTTVQRAGSQTLVSMYRYGHCLMVCEYDAERDSQGYLLLDRATILEAFLCIGNQPRGKLFHFHTKLQLYESLCGLVHISDARRGPGKQARTRLEIQNLKTNRVSPEAFDFFSRDLTSLDESDAVICCGMMITGHHCLVEISHNFSDATFHILVCDLDTLFETPLSLKTSTIDPLTPHHLRGTIDVFEILLGALEFERDKTSSAFDGDLKFSLKRFEELAQHDDDGPGENDSLLNTRRSRRCSVSIDNYGHFNSTISEGISAPNSDASRSTRMPQLIQNIGKLQPNAEPEVTRPWLETLGSGALSDSSSKQREDRDLVAKRDDVMEHSPSLDAKRDESFQYSKETLVSTTGTQVDSSLSPQDSETQPDPAVFQESKKTSFGMESKQEKTLELVSSHTPRTIPASDDRVLPALEVKETNCIVEKLSLGDMMNTPQVLPRIVQHGATPRLIADEVTPRYLQDQFTPRELEATPRYLATPRELET